MTLLAPLPLRWHPSEFDARVGAVLESWVGTPYHLSQQRKGEAVDCVRFVAGALDELYGWTRAPIDRLPPDTALHDPQGAMAAMRAILRLYQPNEEVPLLDTEAGDVLVVGPPHGGPGHAMIVGARPATLYHATASGVQRSGLLLPAGSSARLFRLLDREAWLR